MGRIKNWEKTLNESNIFHYYNSKSKVILRGQKVDKWNKQFTIKTTKWQLVIGKNILGKIIKDNITTKSKAILYARAYMRSHPLG